MEAAGRVAVVTGGASGIGAALCGELAQRGARAVVVADIDAAGARRVADAVGGRPIACDVASAESVQRLAAAVIAEYGAIDLFCANAGIGSGTDPFETPLPVWQRMWDVNVMSHVHAVRSVLPGMLERGDGHFLHTASISGVLTAHGMLPYATTKHALVGLVEWLSVTYGHRGVGFSCLCPLGVRTPMLKTLPPEMAAVAGPFSEPEDIARIALDGVADDQLLIYSDPKVETWVTRRFADEGRWLASMRKIQATVFDKSAFPA